MKVVPSQNENEFTLLQTLPTPAIKKQYTVPYRINCLKTYSIQYNTVKKYKLYSIMLRLWEWCKFCNFRKRQSKTQISACQCHSLSHLPGNIKLEY